MLRRQNRKMGRIRALENVFGLVVNFTNPEPTLIYDFLLHENQFSYYFGPLRQGILFPGAESVLVNNIHHRHHSKYTGVSHECSTLTVI